LLILQIKKIISLKLKLIIKTKLLQLFFILFILYGCKPQPKKEAAEKIKVSNNLLASWGLYDVSSMAEANTSGDDALLEEAKSKKKLKDGILFSIFKDGTFSDVRKSSEYINGTWKNTGDKLFLDYKNSTKTDTLYIQHDLINEQQSLSLYPPTKKFKLQFVEYAPSMENFKEDPFYSANNLWRKKPSHAETPSEIQDRLGNYFKHLIYILKAAKERKQQVVSFEYSQGIVKIYSGGIGIEEPSQVANSWINSYYNNDDAKAAYKMFSIYLRHSHYKGAAVGDWIQDDYNILLSIYEDLKEGAFLKPVAEN
jgi:hypothetical protein